MKPKYNELNHMWGVSGKGFYKTPQEAWRVIRENELSKMLTLMISPKMAKDLQTIAKAKSISVSEVVRQAIQKEVITNG